MHAPVTKLPEGCIIMLGILLKVTLKFVCVLAVAPTSENKQTLLFEVCFTHESFLLAQLRECGEAQERTVFCAFLNFPTILSQVLIGFGCWPDQLKLFMSAKMSC